MSVITLGRESIDSVVNAGHGVAIITEAPVSAIRFAIWKYIVVKADSANTDVIYLGARGYAASGFVLHPGDSSPPIPVDHSDSLGLCSGSGSQSFSYVAV
jgi:hypothetical protein